jgi:hypothetical protein
LLTWKSTYFSSFPISGLSLLSPKILVSFQWKKIPDFFLLPRISTCDCQLLLHGSYE